MTGPSRWSWWQGADGAGWPRRHRASPSPCRAPARSRAPASQHTRCPSAPTEHCDQNHPLWWCGRGSVGLAPAPALPPLQGSRHRSPQHWGAVQWGSPTLNPPSFPSAPQPRHSRDEQRSAPRTQGCERCGPRQPPAPSPAPSPQPRPSPLRWRWRRVLPDKGRGTAMGSRLRVVYGLLPVIN